MTVVVGDFADFGLGVVPLRRQPVECRGRATPKGNGGTRRMPAMHDLTQADVAALAEQYNLPVADSELGELVDLVNDGLGDLEAVRHVPTDRTAAVTGNREWWRPSPDEYNAVVTACEVPPPDGADDELAGVSIGLKDNIAVAGVPMTCASPVMDGYVPDEDAVVVERLLDAGATVAAKTNLDAFGNVGQGTNGLFGPVRNPHDTDRTAGGSSGGSAVAVLEDRVDVALGSDTGGSVRIPAAYCGLVGYKPTAGLVPSLGMFENTPLFDCIGPITETVSEAAAVFDAIAGPIEIEPLTVRADWAGEYAPGDATAAVHSAIDPSSLTLGILDHGFDGNTTHRVAQQIHKRLDAVADTGATLVDIEVDHVEHATPVKNTLSLVSNAMYWGNGTHENRDERSRRSLPADFTVRRDARGRRLNTELKAKVVAGAALLEDDGGALYRTAMAAREVLQDSFETALSDVDALVTPTMPTVATPLEDSPPAFDYGQNVRPASVTGGPAVTVPGGSVDELPVGLHLAGPRHGDADLLRVAAAVESVD